MKLVIDEPESAAVDRHLAGSPVLATSRIATVEVGRATAVANPSPEVREETELLLASCLLVEASAELLQTARELASRSVRTLDAIHLASARRVGADELVAYDRRLLTAARALGLAVASPN